jgi:hypothetical protein
VYWNDSTLLLTREGSSGTAQHRAARSSHGPSRRSGNRRSGSEEGIMRLRTLQAATLVAGLATASFACTDDGATGPAADSSVFAAAKGGGGGSNGLSVLLSGDLDGGAEPQTVGGRNDSRTLAIKGDYVLKLAVDTVNLVCDYTLKGKVPDEPGLVRLVQRQPPQVGTLDIQYDKTQPDAAGQAGRIDSWTTTIGAEKFWVQFFRWGTADLDETDGTTVTYRGASIVVFRMHGRQIISHEQCFGPFLDYDLMVQ